MKSILALALLLASCAGRDPADVAGDEPVARVFLRCTPEAEGVLVNVSNGCGAGEGCPERTLVMLAVCHDGVWAVGVP